MQGEHEAMTLRANLGGIVCLLGVQTPGGQQRGQDDTGHGAGDVR